MARRNLHDAVTRSRAAKLYGEGCGVRSIADSIHVPYEAARRWGEAGNRPIACDMR